MTKLQAVMAENELTSRKSGKTVVTSLKVNEVSVTDPTENSNEFNYHFASIRSTQNRQLFSALPDQC